MQTAPLPPLIGGTGWSTLSFSCPTVETCAIVEVPIGAVTGGTLAQFIFTTDGGANWAASAIPVPSGIPDPSASRFTCGDATHCVVSVTGSPAEASGTGSSPPPQRVGTFLSTADAGLTWTQATSVPSAPAGGVWTMNCGTDGSCVAVSALGDSRTTTSWGCVLTIGASPGSPARHPIPSMPPFFTPRVVTQHTAFWCPLARRRPLTKSSPPRTPVRPGKCQVHRQDGKTCRRPFRAPMPTTAGSPRRPTTPKARPVLTAIP